MTGDGVVEELAELGTLAITSIDHRRDRERAQLRELLDDFEDGHGSLVLIGGEAGIGKTTLIEDLIEEAQNRECLVLSGGCYDLATTPPYGPWTEALNRYRPGEGDPELPPWFHNPEEFEQVGSQQALFEEAARFLRAVASQRPVVTILEDLHWSDPATLEALRYLARALADAAVLLVSSYRDDELTRRHELYQLMPILIRESRAERIYLNRLDEEAAGRLIRDRYELSADDIRRLTSYIQERSEGNPFSAEELLRGLEDEGTLRSLDGGAQLGALTEMIVPPMLRQVIEGRLQRLDERALGLLEIAAVIGHEASLDLWQQVSGAEASELNAAMVAALDANVIDESPDGASLLFHHALMREALYTGIAPLQRRELHRAVVERLIEEPGADPDEVVTHLEHAFDPRALEWLVRAGDRAMRSFAWEVAAERYERALELLERRPDPDPVQHCEILLALGEAQSRIATGRIATRTQPGLGAGASRAGRDTYWRTADIARDANLPEQLAEAAIGVVGFNPYPHQAGIEGIHLLEEALDRLPSADTPLRVRILARLSLDPYMLASGWDEYFVTEELEGLVRERSDEAVAVARRLDDPASLAYALIMRGLQHDLRSEDEWLEGAEEAVQAATKADDRTLLALALLGKAVALESRGDIAAKRRVMDQRAIIAEQLRVPFFLFNGAIWNAASALVEGRLVEAEHHLDSADRLQPDTGIGMVIRTALYVEQRRDEELIPILERYKQLVRNNNVSRFFRLLDVFVRVQTGQHTSARQAFDTTVEEWNLARGFRRRWLARLAEVCAGVASVEHANRLYEALMPYARLNVYLESSDIGGCVSYYLGLLATTLELWDEAEEHFNVALELNSEWGYRLHIANTQYAWGEMLLRRGRAEDRQRALELLEQARALAGEMGSVRLQRLIDELVPQPSATRTAYPAGLTQREVEVLRLVARGMTDAEIAEKLYISPRTVSQHLRNCYNKLGVNNRAEAAVWAVEADLFTDPA